jgi:uncharacterized membrane protein HdeD (DUF308 family)
MGYLFHQLSRPDDPIGRGDSGYSLNNQTESHQPMTLSTLLRRWWVILVQGILMIGLSVVIFNNPDAVLATVALWLGITVIVAGLVGVIAYLSNTKGERDIFTLLGNGAILLVGILMISKMFVTIKAITIAFGLLAAIIGLVLIVGSWSGRKQWSLWWVIALLGTGAIITGIKSIIDVSAGSENISTLIGLAVLISGIGLVCLAFLKKKIAITMRSKVTEIKS